MTKETISAYLNWYRTKNQEYWWAWEVVDNMTSPNDLPFIFKLIDSCLNDAEIAYVAAGPLSDLISKHHLEIKDTLDKVIRKKEHMRKAIQAIIFQRNTPERKTLEELLLKYGLHYASL